MAQQQQLSQADKEVYNKIFQSIKKIDKKVQNAKTKLNHNNEQKQQKNVNFKQIAQKIIQSKQNSDINNKEDILTDINQSFQRAVIDIYSQNQKNKKKMLEMQKIIKQQNHKLFQQQNKQQKLNQQIQKLKLQLANLKDNNLMNQRGATKLEDSKIKQTGNNKKGLKNSQNQNQDYDFWNKPQNQNNYAKKKKQFVENSGLWVNQKTNDSMFITEGKH